VIESLNTVIESLNTLTWPGALVLSVLILCLFRVALR
jgi:hypothetical protein